MPSKERNAAIDSFLVRAKDLTDEVISTFANEAQAEARWKKSKESRRKG